MKYLLSFFFLFFTIAIKKVYAQEIPINLEVTMAKNNGPFVKGEKVKFVSLTRTLTNKDTGNEFYDIFFLNDSRNRSIEIKNKMDKLFIFNYKDVQSIWDYYIITNVLYHNFDKAEKINELRRELTDEATDVFDNLKSYDQELDDPFLKTYLYSLIYKISPKRLVDNSRSKHLNIIIKRDNTLNACTLPNGTIVINTGLLASLHSEDELVAVLAHELTHFVLDHTIININKAETRQKWAEFWASLATGVTAVAEGVIAAKRDYYYPGFATLGMAAISSGIAENVINRLGMKYNHDQEYVADKIAFYILDVLGYNKNAMATVLQRIENHYLEENDDRVYFSSYTHPMLESRIREVGVFQDLVETRYEQLVSFAITDVAITNFYYGKYSNCLELVRQNIRNNVATADDFLLAANCLQALYDTAESNQETLRMINVAKEVDSTNINCYKVEILLMLKMGDYQTALNLLEIYHDMLIRKVSLEITSMNDMIQKYTFEFALREQEWSKRMISKLKGMIASD